MPSCGGAPGIARTTIIVGYAPHVRANFVLWLVGQLREGKRVRIIYDQIGSPTLAENLAEMVVALARSDDHGIFNTVGADVMSRLEFARTLVARRPTVVRLNAAELAALSGEEASADSARRFAARSGSVIAVTGEVDVVTDGERLVTVHNGDELMAKVTAMGCAGSAFVAAALATEHDRWQAAVSAMIVFGVAGELAADRSDGPGSLAFAILDTLHAMTPDMVQEDAWVES